MSYKQKETYCEVVVVMGKNDRRIPPRRFDLKRSCLKELVSTTIVLTVGRLVNLCLLLISFTFIRSALGVDLLGAWQRYINIGAEMLRRGTNRGWRQGIWGVLGQGRRKKTKPTADHRLNWRL